MDRKPLRGSKALTVHSGKSQQTGAWNHLQRKSIHRGVHLHDQAIGVKHQGLGA